jgi:hypothetical protein
MKIRPITSLLPAAIALALAGPLHAAGDVPGFNEMDKNSDGQLTRSEAQGNPKLADQFAQVDDDNNGTLSRAEYLAIMGRQDLYTLRENLAEFIDPDAKQPPLAAGSQQQGQASAGAGGGKQSSQYPPRAASEKLVRNVQQTLQDKGVEAGPIDGIWGPKTSAGVRQFQQQQKLETTGQLNAQTLDALGIAEGAASAGESGKAAAKSGTSEQRSASAEEGGKQR